MSQKLSVAIPWSQSHYIPLNGFHPLYRALFESKPDWVELSAWDNIELSQKLYCDASFRREILQEVDFDVEDLKLHSTHRHAKEYFAHFGAPNLALTRLLPGDIEFHHTAPFPSLKRPFVFHCESFAPVFFPFSHQGTGNFPANDGLRDHYRELFEHPLCIGISSHLSQTLEDLSRFFASPLVDAKLFPSRIGLYGGNSEVIASKKGPLSAPLFLFINSANQNPRNFFLRGGHVVLRFWQHMPPEMGSVKIIMRCTRPTDEMLEEYGVDMEWLLCEEGRSVIWVEGFLSAADIDSFTRAAHFFLLPSASLHSVSIMQAMMSGAVPVVSDTIGTDRYVEDDVDGVRLCGVLASNWHRDSESGVMIDCYARNLELEESLIQQLLVRVGQLLATPGKYAQMQARAIEKARSAFSGQTFSEDFWEQVQQRYLALSERMPKSVSRPKGRPGVERCLVEQSEWSRIFSSAPQPIPRLHTGQGQVMELGGCFIAAPGTCVIGVHDWSPLAMHFDASAPPLIFAADIKGLGGRYLGCPISEPVWAARRLVAFVATRLTPYPRLYFFAAGVLKQLSRVSRVVCSRFPRIALAMKPAVVEVGATIELVMQNVNGLNIIRCGNVFYAISQAAGEFSQARAEAGKYKPCISGTSLKDVLRQIKEMPSQPTRPDIELIEEGIRGFNLIRCGSLYYAVPQSEGVFSMSRVRANDYSRVHVGDTPEVVRAALVGGGYAS